MGLHIDTTPACTAQPSLGSEKLSGLPAGAAVPHTFFARPADEVAADLVGKVLWRKGVGGGRLTEVEAYLPADDPACHAFRGPSKRNRAMFGPPGTVYVYRSYGIHVLLNLVCEEESVGAAVLIRCFEPLGDTTLLRRNRSHHKRQQDTGFGRSDGTMRATWLSCGPGRVGQALGLHLALDGLHLGERSGLFVFDDGLRPSVARATRIGITKGQDLPLRFVAADSPFVTGRRRTPGGGEHETT